ncbi:MAG: type 4a pilus biogenesis protein PilO [Candidatus Omnitrophota bacterium]
MKTKAISRRERRLVLIIFSLALASVIFNFLLQPLFRTLDRVNQDIERKEALARKHSRLLGKGENILLLYDKYKNAMEAKGDSDELIAGLFSEIEDVANKFSLVVEKIKPRAAESRKDYKQVSIEVELRGSVSAIFKFINHMEDGPSFVEVSALRISPQASFSNLICKVILSKLFF